MSATGSPPDGILLGIEQLADGIVEKEVSIRAPADPEKKYLCPVCESNSVLVEGAFRRPFHEVFKEGASQGHELARDVEKNILAVRCATCMTRYVYEPEEVYVLREYIIQLQLQLAASRQFVPVPQSNERIN